jgi:tetratricopeptide repeat protein
MALCEMRFTVPRQGRLAESERWLMSAISLRHDLGDWYREAKSRTVLGSVLLRTGRQREAADDLRRALAVFGEVGDQRWARRAQPHLGQTG